jgi:hypothetical protein
LRATRHLAAPELAAFTDAAAWQNQVEFKMSDALLYIRVDEGDGCIFERLICRLARR